MTSNWDGPISAAALREAFDKPRPFAVGVEEEIMLLDPGSLDLLPDARELLEEMRLDPRFKTELPASQIEIATSPASTLALVQEELFQARRLLAERLGGRALLAVAGMHPFSGPSGLVTDSERYRHTLSRYGPVARQQLVCGLHVHLGISGADRVLRVYNEMRNYLPEIAALAANAPIFLGRDTELASIRPQIAGMMPRQGVPPALPSWEWLAEELEWGRTGGSLSRFGEWWWEMRPNIAFGTLEIRVPDAQTTVTDAIAVSAVVTALALWISERIDIDPVSEPVPEWRISENRWSAARFGVDGFLADPRTGRRRRTRDRLLELIEATAPAAGTVAGDGLLHALRLLERGPAARQREVLRASGAQGVAEWLAERFLEPPLRGPAVRESRSPVARTFSEPE
jgi:glutamate---cysteine ligase / carboxylate-amine ligase